MKNRLSFVISALLTVMLFAGIPAFTCNNSPLNMSTSLGRSIGVVLVVYAVATAFAMLGTVFQYIYAFAGKGTALRPTMPRNRVLLLVGVVAAIALRLKRVIVSH
ncbi:hypothetical protein [Paraburkholderia sp. BL21I4N1]|uniref:hypothetical protein n=1 Tax=Paraburkholderia sp. BL21I4N1 TaxID=1938801 RepID=UPI0011B1D4CF|nr:hypothetical protein [Paraburkholderia sp. BL21I4N1]